MATAVMGVGCGCAPVASTRVSSSLSSSASTPVSSSQLCSAPASRYRVKASSSLVLHSAFTSQTWSIQFFTGGAGRLALAAAVASACITDGRNGGGALAAQANIFERIVRVVKSYANAVVSAAEDPEKLLDQTVNEMNEDLTKMRQASAQVLASQKQLENKYKAAQQTADDWYRRAKLALEKGDESLAKEALKRRKDYEESAKALKNQLDQQKGVVEKLISNTRLLESKIQEAKSKKDTLKARAQSAKTAQKVNEMLGNINTSSALAAFDKMEEKVNALEAEADALNQLSTDDLAGKFALLEGSDVDDDLAALKRDVLGTPAKISGELPAGRTSASSSSSRPEYPFKDFEIEKELNELRRKTNEL
ncbi:phage shock protein A [Marchantia polymorpha subsp. ruderalis]|uniref:Membrane-associated 30 kDa protein, chloroplastic n=2 Tax=Marchantia polymorpha TaxID=3197 RepID=A0AAF6BKH2_MARPO|nr:hypothetical protein MARPO_0058s0048 [Marchantia polymorpha]BBN12506.1 hypothetical protein Mp_5g20680 [Marchantia polymorpha subsp. ruderalis]|eukprot:PTQ37260.1 hypothetical protein MARPO_0058s0048 [Marchantia polymorpha]